MIEFFGIFLSGPPLCRHGHVYMCVCTHVCTSDHPLPCREVCIRGARTLGIEARTSRLLRVRRAQGWPQPPWPQQPLLSTDV